MSTSVWVPPWFRLNGSVISFCKEFSETDDLWGAVEERYLEFKKMGVFYNRPALMGHLAEAYLGCGLEALSGNGYSITPEHEIVHGYRNNGYEVQEDKLGKLVVRNNRGDKTHLDIDAIVRFEEIPMWFEVKSGNPNNINSANVKRHIAIASGLVESFGYIIVIPECYQKLLRSRRTIQEIEESKGFVTCFYPGFKEDLRLKTKELFDKRMKVHKRGKRPWYRHLNQ